MRPSIRQLEYAVALADALHFGHAAKACAVSQPGLSTQLQLLEEELGVQLFERSKRRVSITSAGASVIERARDVLRASDELVHAARASQGTLVGPLHLGVIPTVAPYLLPHWLPIVRRAFPQLKLILREDQTHRLVHDLGIGKVEILLLALPIDDEGIESMDLFEEPFLIAAPKTHRLAKQPIHPVADSVLESEAVLLLEDGHCLRDQALSVCGRVGASEAEDLRASSLTTLIQMVAHGWGITLLPASAAIDAKRVKDLRLIPFRKPAPSRRIGLVWRKTSARKNEFLELGALLRENLPKL